jgi:hypothetical protein
MRELLPRRRIDRWIAPRSDMMSETFEEKTKTRFPVGVSTVGLISRHNEEFSGMARSGNKTARRQTNELWDVLPTSNAARLV